MPTLKPRLGALAVGEQMEEVEPDYAARALKLKTILDPLEKALEDMFAHDYIFYELMDVTDSIKARDMSVQLLGVIRAAKLTAAYRLEE